MYTLLLLLFFVSACTFHQTARPLGPELGVAVALPTVAEVTQAITETKTYQRAREPERLLYVSPAGSDKTPCADISLSLPAKTIKRAVQCMKPCESTLIQAGEYNESVVVEKGGESGCPIELQGEGLVIWRGVKKQKALSVLGSYVQVRGLIFDDVLLGSAKGGSQGLLFSRNAVRGTLTAPNLGTVEEDPGIAANIIEYSAFEGPVDIRGHDVVLRGNITNRATLAGKRFLAKYNTFKGRVVWNVAKSHAEENEFRGEVTIGSPADNALFGKGNEFQGTVTLGTAGAKDQAVGVTFHQCRFRGAMFNALNARSTIFMGNDSEIPMPQALGR